MPHSDRRINRERKNGKNGTHCVHHTPSNPEVESRSPAKIVYDQIVASED